ncbi:uncharacterized protein DSM5745_03884 [Aspergillus mulundensis]|uniref:Granulins domain-containing protein n=1 Tax=Aspergillus mulundensis TaxID=1810919 RepID=A0A3D8SCR1_9EURO|nr:hypothetical protein DSM5745_03884 [Aspergillus mulundensis]RDW83558.1 hypothetical protein DSM5745_03884 [Aspergillus mulundensis]
MSSRTTISLHRTLLYLLSLSSISFATEQDVLDDSGRGLYPSHGSRVLLTKTVSYNHHVPVPTRDTPNTLSTSSEPSPVCPSDQKPCRHTCIPSTQDCCSADQHCLPGDYCYIHSGSVRCCPQGLSCFQISGDVCFEQTVIWYEEVHIVNETEDDSDGAGAGEAVTVTSWELLESARPTSSRITVTASYPAEGRAAFTSLSQRIVEAAVTPVALALALDEIPTRTVTLRGPGRPTLEAEAIRPDL